MSTLSWFDTPPFPHSDLQLFDRAAPVPQWFQEAIGTFRLPADIRSIQELFLRWGVRCAWQSDEIGRALTKAGFDHDVQPRRGKDIASLPKTAPDHRFLIPGCPSLLQPPFDTSHFSADTVAAGLLDWSDAAFGGVQVELAGFLLRWGVVSAENASRIKRLITGRRQSYDRRTLDPRTIFFS